MHNAPDVAIAHDLLFVLKRVWGTERTEIELMDPMEFGNCMEIAMEL